MSQNGEHTRKKAGKGKKFRAVLILLLVLIVAALAAGYGIFHHLYGMMNTSGKLEGDPTSAPMTVTPEPTEEPPPQTPPPNPPPNR